MDSITLDNNYILSVENKVEGFSISEVTADKHELITEIRNPNGESSVVWHIRLLEYISKTGTGFFCMDRNLREETCVIMDFLNNEILHERIDLKGFVYSRENDIGAFIDRKENTLFLYFEENENIKQVRTYQAIAQSIRPVILAGGEELIYVVQGLNKPRNLYIERIDLKEGKVIKRYDINELKNIEISSISARKADGVWAAADSAGRIYLVDPESEEVFHTFQASENGIIDMLFSSDGRSIIMMDRIGLIQVWIVGD